jgi:hypothetical protein
VRWPSKFSARVQEASIPPVRCDAGPTREHLVVNARRLTIPAGGRASDWRCRRRSSPRLSPAPRVRATSGSRPANDRPCLRRGPAQSRRVISLVSIRPRGSSHPTASAAAVSGPSPTFRRRRRSWTGRVLPGAAVGGVLCRDVLPRGSDELAIHGMARHARVPARQRLASLCRQGDDRHTAPMRMRRPAWWAEDGRSTQRLAARYPQRAQRMHGGHGAAHRTRR